MSTERTTGWEQMDTSEGTSQRQEPRYSRDPTFNQLQDKHRHLQGERKEGQRGQNEETAQRRWETEDKAARAHNPTYNFINFHNGKKNTNRQGFSIDRQQTGPDIKLVRTYKENGELVVNTRRNREEGTTFIPPLIFNNCHHDELQQCIQGICGPLQPTKPGGMATSYYYGKKSPAGLQGTAMKALSKTCGPPLPPRNGTGPNYPTKMTPAEGRTKAKSWDETKATPWDFNPTNISWDISGAFTEYKVKEKETRTRIRQLRLELARLEKELHFT
jgi:hypothetical protein